MNHIMMATAPIQIIGQSSKKNYSIVQISDKLLEKIIIREQRSKGKRVIENCNDDEIKILSQMTGDSALSHTLSNKKF